MKQDGQAMAEFSIAAAVLALVLLAMPIIARYHELQLAAIEGARQLAFLDSWNLTGRSNAHVGAVRAALFPTVAHDGLPEAGAMDATLEVGASPGNAGTAAKTWLAPFRFLGSSNFDLRDHGLHAAALKVTVTSPADLPDPFAGLKFDLRSRYEVLGDDWASPGPAQVARRASGLMVPPAASALRPLLSVGKELLALVEPAFRDFCPGLVDPEQVPADRLGPPTGDDGLQTTGWRPQC